MINVLIWGAGGRMGGRLVRLIGQSRDFVVVGAVETDGHPGVFQDVGSYHQLGELGVQLNRYYEPEATLEKGVVLDFSLAGGLQLASEWAKKHGWALVSGTTAPTDSDRLALDAAALSVPAMYAPNYSIGIQLLLGFVRRAASALPDTFDSMITETHHAAKKDRPSGTALAFRDRITAGKDRRLDMADLRGGNVTGEHSIRFISDLEDITLSHSAKNRDVFAAGALDAARWLIRQAPGLYALADMLELS